MTNQARPRWSAYFDQIRAIRGSIPLEFRFGAELEIGRRIGSFVDANAEEIEAAGEGVARGRSNLQVVDSGISHLQADAIFVVLYDSVVLAQFFQRRKDIVGEDTHLYPIIGVAY